MAVPWHRATALDDDCRVWIVASMGACPPARVEVEERRDALLIRLFERRPPRFWPDGRPSGIPLIGKTASFDIVLGNPVGARRLIDGATGRDPNKSSDALGIDVTGPRVEVPIGQSFDWKELTGSAWFELRAGDDAPDPPPAEIRFFG